LPHESDAQLLEQSTQTKLARDFKMLDLLARPEVKIANLIALPKVKTALELSGVLNLLQQQAFEQIEIQTKYAGYIEKQYLEIQKCAKQENALIPEDFQYHGIPGLSAELVEKLSKNKPVTVGMASRIPGVTPAAISLLLIYLKKHRA